jgi:penicillin amidase
MQELTAAMYARHVPMPESTDRGDLRSIQVVLRHLRSPTSAWFGDNAESERNELLISALSRAVERVQQRLGSDASQWQWGQVHQAVFHHPWKVWDRSMRLHSIRHPCRAGATPTLR